MTNSDDIELGHYITLRYTFVDHATQSKREAPSPEAKRDSENVDLYIMKIMKINHIKFLNTPDALKPSAHFLKEKQQLHN